MEDVIVPSPPVAKLTFEFYADPTIAAGASYVPVTAGFYHCGGAIAVSASHFAPEYYSPTAPGWLKTLTYDSYARPAFGCFISDGSNFRIRNITTTAYSIVLMRAGYTKPNPTPKVGIVTKYGTEIIVLELDERGFIWIERGDLVKPCEDIFPEVQEAKEKGEPHPLIGKTLLEAIKGDVEDKMGWGRSKPLLRELGYDV